MLRKLAVISTLAILSFGAGGCTARTATHGGVVIKDEVAQGLWNKYDKVAEGLMAANALALSLNRGGVLSDTDFLQFEQRVRKMETQMLRADSAIRAYERVKGQTFEDTATGKIALIEAILVEIDALIDGGEDE